MFIQNVSLADVAKGNHFDAGDNSMLIQIMDPIFDEKGIPRHAFPSPKMNFKEIHQFRFLDADEQHHLDVNIDSNLLVSNENAKELVDLLQKALDDSMNVIVHCHAGICRSGAVCEIGVTRQ